MFQVLLTFLNLFAIPWDKNFLFVLSSLAFMKLHFAPLNHDLFKGMPFWVVHIFLPSAVSLQLRYFVSGGEGRWKGWKFYP